MKITPYETSNLIFIDTEFSDLDPYSGEILSIGIVKLSGEELYIELDYTGKSSKWVRKNILKTLKQTKISRQAAVDQIRAFIGEEEPFAVAFVDNYDVIYLTKLFGAGQLPFKWMTVDFASILFANGINPVKFQLESESAKSFYASLGIDTKKYKHHHALDDARLVRDVWLKLVEES